MTALVLGGTYVSPRGREPSRPAFLFDFHNDAAGGTSVTDRFGNAAALTLQGTLGTAWTASRGWWRPGGADTQAITGTTNEYAGQTVMGNALLTPGQALIVACRFGWAGAKNSSNEVFLNVGRSTATTPMVAFGLSSAGLMNLQMRGTNASAISSATFGSAGDFSTTADISLLWHVTATSAGLEAVAFKDGAAIGALQTFTWAANGGSTPTVAQWAMPDGITLGGLRGGSSGSPSFTQRVGASNTGGTRLANVLAVNLAAANVSTAAALALELHQYPRHVGEILASI